MIDPGTGLTILGSAIGGAKVLEKILGPTSEYVGDQIKEWTIKKVTNTANIFKNAEKKIGKRIEENGNVPPKVLKGILEDGAWCEESLQVEYFGGVLASSRSGISRDDRGAYYTSLISRLSSYQLRAHYLAYKSLKSHFNGEEININEGSKWHELEIFISWETFFKSMDFVDEEVENWHNIMSHTMFGLKKEELISNFIFGPKDHLIKSHRNVEAGGIIFVPSKLGVEFFMWAFGLGQMDNNNFFSKEIEFIDEQEITIGETIPLKKIKK